MEDPNGRGTQLSVLGRVEVSLADSRVDLGTPRQRAIVAALALAEGRAVPFDVLVERVWGAAAPATAISTLQRYVASLRGAIETGRHGVPARSVLVTEGAAYALRVPDGARDTDRLAAGVAAARQLLAIVPNQLRPVVATDHVPQVLEAYDLLSASLRLWRGRPYSDLGDHDVQVVAERSRLDDLHLAACELRVVALLAAGRHAVTLGELEAMTALHPLHERWWALRALALVRSGRQARALEVLGRLRTVLAEELGVDPSPPLRQLYADILQQDESLEWRVDPAVTPSGRRDTPVAPPPSTRPAPARPQWPLVGRSGELELLATSIGAARTHAFRPVLVTGEAGAGKSRLVQELMLASHEDEVTVVRAQCSERAPALWPVQRVVEGLGETIDRGMLRDRADHFETWQHLVETLRRTSSGGPVLVVVEDLQWADPVTLQFLEHVVATGDVGALALVLTRRTHEGREPWVSRLAAAVTRADGLRLDLGRLSPEEASRLAETVNPDLGHGAVVAERSGGNAFFLVELARAGGQVSGGLADSIRMRVARLDDSSRAALAAVSAIEGDVDRDRLAALLGCTPDEAEARVEAAHRAGFIVRHGGSAPWYAFEHEVVRDVLRLDLPPALRARGRRAVVDLVHRDPLAPHDGRRTVIDLRAGRRGDECSVVPIRE